jgi:hypothetical protein
MQFGISMGSGTHRMDSPNPKSKTKAYKMNQNEQGVYQPHCGLAIYILKKYLKAKRRSMKTQQIFHHAKT